MAKHIDTTLRRLEKNIFPYIGSSEINTITPQDILECLRRIEERGSNSVATRVLGSCSMIFRYGVAIGVCESDPCRDLKGALVPYKKGKFAAITTEAGVRALIKNIHNYCGSIVVKNALLFSAYTFCRPGEIRQAEWNEINFEEKIWIIPASKMKMGKEHIVPLSRQCLSLLTEIRNISYNSIYVFPNPRSFKRPLSDGGVLAAIRSMGYSTNEMTAHGFRSMASSLLNEKGIAKYDVIETQLAHAGIDKIRAIYMQAPTTSFTNLQKMFQPLQA